MGAASGYAMGAVCSWMFGSVAAGGLGGALPPVLASFFFKGFKGPHATRPHGAAKQEEMKTAR